MPAKREHVPVTVARGPRFPGSDRCRQPARRDTSACARPTVATTTASRLRRHVRGFTRSVPRPHTSLQKADRAHTTHTYGGCRGRPGTRATGVTANDPTRRRHDASTYNAGRARGHRGLRRDSGAGQRPAVRVPRHGRGRQRLDADGAGRRWQPRRPEGDHRRAAAADVHRRRPHEVHGLERQPPHRGSLNDIGIGDRVWLRIDGRRNAPLANLLARPLRAVHDVSDKDLGDGRLFLFRGTCTAKDTTANKLTVTVDGRQLAGALRDARPERLADVQLRRPHGVRLLEHGRPRKVDENNVPCGADGTPLALRIRAPKLTPLAALVAKPAALVNVREPAADDENTPV